MVKVSVKKEKDSQGRVINKTELDAGRVKRKIMGGHGTGGAAGRRGRNIAYEKKVGAGNAKRIVSKAFKNAKVSVKKKKMEGKIGIKKAQAKFKSNVAKVKSKKK